MKNNGTKRRTKKKYIFLIVALVVVAALLALAALYLYGDPSDRMPLVRSETMVLLVALALLLPVLLVVMLITFLSGKKGGKTESGESAVPVQAVYVKQAGAAFAGGEEKEETPSEEGASRFGRLSEVDANRASYVRNSYDDNVTLKGICEGLRNFAAGNLRLYYSIDDIRRFIAGLLVSPIMILQGMSGTGKTSLACAFGKFVDNTSMVVPVQPMWKERTDLLGYYNEFTRRFTETDLLVRMYEANYSKDIFITVLDEMNIARVEYYFAEFLSLLELAKSDRKLTVISDSWKNDPVQLHGGKIDLPENMWFIGTANNDDSTFAISDKVYDRAMIMNLDDKAEEFYAEKQRPLALSAERFKELGREAEQEYRMTARNRKRLERMDAFLKENFHVTFGNRIMKQIRAYVPIYVACGGDELEALDDILAKKVMRKLSVQNPVYLRNHADRFCRYLDELFGEENMTQCKAAMRRLQLNA